MTRQERFVYDVTSSTTLNLHESLLAIVIECDGVSFFGGAHPQPLPPRYAELPLRQAASLGAALSGASKNALYARALELQTEQRERDEPV